MDSNRFDHLTKSLAEPQTRRRVIGMLGAALGALVGGTAVASAAPKDPKKCYGGGSSCTNAKQCCSGICTNRQCAPEGPAPQCKVGTDCSGTDTDCQKRTCTSGVCGVTYAPAGTPATDPQKGDCFSNVCDGTGGITFAPDDSDVPPVISQCSAPVCSMGNSYYKPVPQGSPCSENGGVICDGNGSCIQSECFSAQDCPGGDVETECHKRTCTFGKCGFFDAPPGTPTFANQVPGDCLLSICDGAGKFTTKPDDSEVPSLPPVECYIGICAQGSAVYVPAKPGTPCGLLDLGVCDGNGACQSA